MSIELLNSLKLPDDIKGLDIPTLKKLAIELREVIIDVTQKNGGHLASNLGVVELTLAMFYVFDFPKDKVIYDVSHQCYVHKILSGRYSEFSSLRKDGGLSGFSSPEESPFDSFVSGHSSTSISVGAGFAFAQKLSGSDAVTISVIGDGAMTGGMVYEALNEVTEINGKQIIVLNDNNMSINKNVGATNSYLDKLRISPKYLSFKRKLKNYYQAKDTKTRQRNFHFMQNVKRVLKRMLRGVVPFENYGISYYGPVDGHDIDALIKYFSALKTLNKPCILHVMTTKGMGYEPAEKEPEKYHGLSCGGCGQKQGRNFSEVFGDKIVSICKENQNTAIVSAAMGSGLGLSGKTDVLGNRFLDVGICEQNAVTMCGAMAASGLKPYFAVYSTFLQRGFDQVLQDVALMKLPVTLCIDRAGIVGEDGYTHQGIFDLSYLSLVPNMTVFSPKDCKELENVLDFSLTFNAPLAIRYPKGNAVDFETHEPIVLGKWEKIYGSENAEICILAVGYDMIKESLKAAEKYENVCVYNARFVKPLDEEVLNRFVGKKVITVEDNVKSGGFGEQVAAFYSDKIPTFVKIFALPDKFIEHASRSELYNRYGLTEKAIQEFISYLK